MQVQLKTVRVECVPLCQTVLVEQAQCADATEAAKYIEDHHGDGYNWRVVPLEQTAH